MHFYKLPKLMPGDRVGIVSPSFIAPAVFPLEFELGLKRLQDIFGLQPVILPNAANPNASHSERAHDLIEAFTNPELKAVIATIGGDHQVEYVHSLPSDPFCDNPKPFFGYSDNSIFANFLFQHGIPSFYGGSIYTEFGNQGAMDEMTIRYLRKALFEGGEVILEPSSLFSDEDLLWGNEELLTQRKRYQPNSGWYWDGTSNAQGISWGGCLESIDDLIRHNAPIPSLKDFEDTILFFETCEELSHAGAVMRFFRALGERGILARTKGVLMGRPKAWNFEHQLSEDAKEHYKQTQRETVVTIVRRYNSEIPIVQNMDFGHTSPSLCLPYGSSISIDAEQRVIRAWY